LRTSLRFSIDKALEEQCLCAQSDRCKECRSRGNLSRFHSPEAQEEECPKNAGETKVVGSQEESKAETFDTSEIFQGEGRSGSSGGSYSYRRISAGRKIWIIEVYVQVQAGKCNGRERDMGHQILRG
jgi:hypothetical protein